MTTMVTIRDLGWWYWFVTVGLLAAGLSGWQRGIYLAIVLCIIQIGHVMRLTHDLTTFPMQVRATYAVMLMAGLWGPLAWLHWMQLVGTSARVLIGYCFLARLLSLAPWNRREPLSWELVIRTFLSGQTVTPSCGAIFQPLWLEQVHR